MAKAKFGDEMNKMSTNKRKEFFKKYNYECTCRIGYCICKNCNIYYDWPFGKLRMIIAYYVEQILNKMKTKFG